MHPAFGSCYATPGCKVAGGYDLVGGSKLGAESSVPDQLSTGDLYDGNTVLTTMPDPDPLASAACGPHGTHVA